MSVREEDGALKNAQNHEDELEDFSLVDELRGVRQSEPEKGVGGLPPLPNEDAKAKPVKSRRSLPRLLVWFSLVSIGVVGGVGMLASAYLPAGPNSGQVIDFEPGNLSDLLNKPVNENQESQNQAAQPPMSLLESDGVQAEQELALVNQSIELPPELGMPEHIPISVSSVMPVGYDPLTNERSLEGVETKKVSIGGYEIEIPAFELDTYIEDLSEIKKRVLGVGEQMTQLYEKVERVVLEDREQDRQLVEMQAQLDALNKEIARLKWLEKKESQARAQVKKQAEVPKIKGFFVWQYKPGVEIDYRGSTDRYYEGDLLGDMRVLRVDLVKSQVIVLKDGKEVSL